jgi:hypothetical protein
LLLLAGVLTWNGCDILGETYVKATLEEVMKRTVKSGTDRYRLAKPRLAAVRENTGIIREGAFFVILLGPDLERIAEKHDLKNIDVGVHVVRQPRTHLVLERLFTAEGEINLFEGEEPVQMRLPRLVGGNQIPFGNFPTDVALDQIDPADSKALRGLPGRKLTLSGFEVERKVVTGECAETVRNIMPDADPDAPHYFLTSEKGSGVLILNEEPMTLLMLDFLLFEDRSFKGGGVIEAIFNTRVREACGVVGSTELKWIDLGGTLYYRVK